MKHDDTWPPSEFTESEDIMAAEGLSLIEDALSLHPESDSSMLKQGEIPGEFDGLILKECIGSGGMGEVYLARQAGLDRDVAVKIRVSRSCDAPFADRLIVNEARNLAELDHPGVAQVHTVGEVAGRRYLVMEHIPGVPLAEYMEQPVPLQDAILVLLGIARALSAAHSRSLPHRDLKPSNIIIAEQSDGKRLDERVRLIDFGLSGRLFDIGGTAHMGTHRYMAPEQRTGSNAGTEADIYALHQTFSQLVDDDWLLIPRSIRKVLRRMAAKAPADRPTAENIVETIESTLAKTPGLTKRRVLTTLLVAFPIVWTGWYFAPSATAPIEDPQVSIESTGPASAQAKFVANRQRFMDLLSVLQESAARELPISEEDLEYLVTRAPKIMPEMYNRASKELARFGVVLAPNEYRGRRQPR